MNSVPVFPVFFDVSPSYLGESSTSRSLLLTPIGTGTLLCRLHAKFTSLGHYRLTIAPTFRPDAAYRAALHGACSAVERAVWSKDLGQFLAGLEPSDWVLFIDPTCVPVESVDPMWVLESATESPRSAIHLVALETNQGGTCEWADVDSHGEVTRIQRYYDEVTWSYTSGVAASLVPVSCLRTVRGVPFESLSALRVTLAAHGILARDVPITGRTFDLSRERELLMFTERVVRSRAAAGPDASARLVGAGARIHESARLLGPVVVQEGARIEDNAFVVGPTVVGAQATIRANAVVVQCIVQSGAIVPEGSTFRHQLVSVASQARALEGSSTRPVYDPSAIRSFHSEVRDGPTHQRHYPKVKLVIDTTLALLALIVLMPLLVVVAALIKLESRGPVLFADRREAKGGRNFPCLKFRTMVHGADAMQRELMAGNAVDGPQFKLRKDPRLTRVGRWLRPSSLDELPQLVNVVLGQMSLVGPRPSPFRENQTCVPWREGRLSVRPGITGLWQVCRHNREEGDFHQWIQYDLLYVKHMSALLDIKIILATIFTLGGRWEIPTNWIIPAARQRPFSC